MNTPARIPLNDLRPDLTAVEDELLHALQSLATASHYSVPLHRAPTFARPDLHLPEAERTAQEVRCLPLWPSIPAQTIDEVVHMLANFLR